MAIHYMLDLETLSTRHDAAIVQVGLVSYNTLTKTREEFKSTVPLTEAMKYGHVAPETLSWWLTQSEEARKSITTPSVDTMEQLVSGIEEFIKTTSEGSERYTHLWGHAGFDYPIICSLFRLFEKNFPIPFWKVRDLRTIDYLSQNVVKKEKREGTHHDALDDANFQLTCLIDMLEQVKTRLEFKNPTN